MNYLFLVNAVILSLIGVFVYMRKQDRLSLILLISNVGLVAWNICVFLIEEFHGRQNIDVISKIKLLGVLLFVSGIFYFCRSYPYVRKGRLIYLNVGVFAAIAVLMLGTDYISHAEVIDNAVVYSDNAIGFPLYTLYLASLGVSALGYLGLSYRAYPEYRSNIKYLFTGLGLFTIFGIGCNLILPLLGYYNWLMLGRISAIFPALFFAYVITKHDFMDLEVVVNKRTSWLVTCGVILGSYGLLYSFVQGHELMVFAALSVAGVFWALSAERLQNFLLTSAKRKFE